MQLVRAAKPIEIRLRKDLTRSIKRGHAWLYSDAIELPTAAAGSVAVLRPRSGDKPIAAGIYSPEHAIPLRVCRTQAPWVVDDAWVAGQLQRAAQLRAEVFDAATTGYRLVAGEGDGLPGLIIDRYDQTAVIKLDGGGPEAFYQPHGIALWLSRQLGCQRVVLRSRQRGTPGQTLVGEVCTAPIAFRERGLMFTADVINGQKTGFFLDQRDNRDVVQQFSRGRRVLNLYSFSGGFSVSAGRGGAVHVTSVDLAAPAIAACQQHWEMNALPADGHTGVVADCFAFLEGAVQQNQQWELVICDPPSFAPNEKSRVRALAAYSRLAQWSAQVTASGGYLALASCSSHISPADFTAANFDGLGRSRRTATLLADRNLPVDHPTPLAMPELRYLKFQLYRLS